MSSTVDPNTFLDQPPNLRANDYFLLHFADNRQIFAQAVPYKRSKSFPPCKINKRTYSTHNLIGLPYGTVLEVGRDELIPLPEGEDLLPDESDITQMIEQQQQSTVTAVDGSKKNDSDAAAVDLAAAAKTDDTATSAATKEEEEPTKDNDNESNTETTVPSKKIIDNRNLIDDNTSQTLTQTQVHTLLSTQTPGSTIVAALISNSSTFSSKTAFSQAKYVKRKQLKYQPRCRIVRITPSTLCSAMHLRDARKICNLREDTLGQVLSNANVCAGQRVLVVDTAVQGIITASCVRRMGGYGSVLSLYCGQQPGYLDVVNRMNFTVMEKQALKWIAFGEVFGDYDEKKRQTERLLKEEESGEIVDVEKRDRDLIEWPASLQPHTRRYLTEDVKNEKKVSEFLSKRSARFTRKLTRNTMLELRELVDGCRDVEENYNAAGPTSSTTASATVGENKEDAGAMVIDDNTDIPQDVRQCDSLIIATKYDPTATLLRLLPYLAPSCPFVIYHEFLEPLLETFRTLQNYYVVENQEDGNEVPMMRRRNIAINLRLTDTWFREFQVLEGRTHPNMSISQNGGYILLGTKLCPKTGTNEMDEQKVREIRARVGGRRGTRRKNVSAKRKNESGGGGKDNEKRAKES
mmetsp:Transcript_13555/g.27512  ORF Transcript_13555/g.27512 Transcript_13555/m.27512 type:complete len:634 (-) Transcript_13555:93-1994(-)